jgi:pimeloyl-ACP methyl ester carboxylesterase
MLQEHIFNTGEVSINYAEGPPSGPPLVLLHGGGGRWQQFLSIIPGLTTRWHIYALDLRGHGKSGRVPGQYRPEHYAADTKAFLEDQIPEAVVLFGHSLGGWIALMVAAELQEKARALILGDAPLDMERYLAIAGSEEKRTLRRSMHTLASLGLSLPELAAKLAELPISLPGQDMPIRFSDLPGRNAAHFRGWAKTLSQVDPGVGQYHAEGRLTEYIEKMDLDTAFQQITCPTLMLQADPSQGGLVSDSEVKHALSLLRDGLYVKLEGAGHDIGMNVWEVAPLLQAVTDFLEAV